MSGPAFVIPDDTRRRQGEASDPAVSAWVSANAGSGKTHVLTERVIRLMLAGSAPERLLCLTFTKAAAATMSNRVFGRLAHWATLPEPALIGELTALDGAPPAPARISRARTLFALAIETPGGLKIQTIHAFCEAILQRFPLEAELAGGFEMLDDVGADDLFATARDRVLAAAALAPDGAEGRALATAMMAMAEGDLGTALTALIDKRDWFTTLLHDHGSLTGLLAALRDALGLESTDHRDRLLAQIVQSPFHADLDVPGLVAALAASGPNDAKQAARLAAAGEGAMEARAAAWLSAFYTESGTARAKAGATVRIHALFPDLQEAFSREIQRLDGIRNRLAALASFETTGALMALGDKVIGHYEAMKHARNMLDFSDLITRTVWLFERQDAAQWIQFKLDKGIDHVLVDEAQDTSPAQWAIISRLTDEFFSGVTARPASRTLFAVGDDKQSIYSFQGARPDAFVEKSRHFRRAAEQAGKTFRDTKLIHSFRSTPDILAAVDRVFTDGGTGAGVTADVWPDHVAIRADAPGQVEIWPLEAPEPAQEPEDWTTPIDRVASGAPAVRLANRIAGEVAALLAPDARLPGTGRPLRARDILILVRRRDGFVEAVNRALRALGIPAAGADRLKLFQHIVARDLIALGAAALRPEDELTLATVLKSPLIGLTEDDLAALAIGRGEVALADRLAEATEPRVAAAAARLAQWRDEARHLRPFEFYSGVLGRDGGRRAFRSRFGSEADDVLDAFLTRLMDHERTHGSDLVAFLDGAGRARLDIRREIDEARDEVRVMTVHGAKGLEAPVVFLVSSAGTPHSAHHDPDFLELPGRMTPLMLWAGRKEDRPAAAAQALEAARHRADEEYRRLLYVAMTRAGDRLIVAGTIGRKKPSAASWYERIAAALVPTARELRRDDGSIDRWIWRATSLPPLPPQEVTAARPVTSTEVPAWLTLPVPSLTEPPVVNPSEIGRRDEGRLGPADVAALAAGADPALLRGRAIHRLLEVLPEIAQDRRRDAGILLAGRMVGPQLSVAPLVDEVLAIMADPRISACFAAGSRAEVPVIGRLALHGRPDAAVSGRVDRLVVTETTVTVIDFKTDRRPPDRVPDVYATQLAVYAALLREVFPRHSVLVGVVWTCLPRVDMIEDGRIDRLLARLAQG